MWLVPVPRILSYLGALEFYVAFQTFILPFTLLMASCWYLHQPGSLSGPMELGPQYESHMVSPEIHFDAESNLLKLPQQHAPNWEPYTIGIYSPPFQRL